MTFPKPPDFTGMSEKEIIKAARAYHQEIDRWSAGTEPQVLQKDEPNELLTRTHVYIYASDVEYLKANLGQSWSAEVRELIRQYVIQLKEELKGTP